MNKAILFCAGLILIVSGSVVRGDLSSEFSGYNAVWEVGVSGLQSSYYAATKSGTTLPNYMFSLGPDRVSYPHGIGEVPSPGRSVGSHFDEGALGIRVQSGDVAIQVAGALNPLTGYYYRGWRTWYSQGDVFITVEDSTGVSHFALLNSWARDGSGSYRTLNRGHFDAAQAFHTQGGPGDTSLEGHLVGLLTDGDVVRAGGRGSYRPSYNPSPVGLDYRVYAQGGVNIVDAGLVHSQVTDFGRDWFIQKWTFPTHWLSSDPVFTIGLHKAASCGNDQIGIVTTVPAPGAFLLGLAGFGTVGLIKKKKTFRIRRTKA